MLCSLQVKNLALIDVLELEFQNGLTILSGETGAGKSVLIGSINLALGAKIDKEVIREGADYAYIELTFQTDDEKIQALLGNMDISEEEDGCLIISRKILPGRSVFRINGETATARQVMQLAELLLDIHGQHEHQSLLKKQKHQEILDSYAGHDMFLLLKQCKEAYNTYQSLQKQLQDASKDQATRIRELELVSFEVSEITEADLKEGEDILLEEEYQKMIHGRKITDCISDVYQMIGADCGENIFDLLGKAQRELNGIAQLDTQIESFSEQLSQIDDLLTSLHRDMASYMEELEFGSEKFYITEQRLNVINHLKAKYGKSIEQIKAYQEQRQLDLERLENYDSYIEKLNRDMLSSKQQLEEICSKISKLRCVTAKELSQRLEAALVDLNFEHVKFSIQVQTEKEKPGNDGWDDVEFLISTNPGQSLKPLHMIASGGELSRIMLGLKTVLAGKDRIETLIFDEIDTGISGKTAWKVSEKLGKLSRERQIICITHLPQIAAMAGTHFKIEKLVEEGVTHTTLYPLDAQEHIQEIARMLGGDEISAAALENAKELVQEAIKSK